MRYSHFMTRKTVFAVLLLFGIATRVTSGVSTDLAVAGRTNGFPSVAASGKFVAIVWGAAAPEAAPDIYSAVSIDSGRTFAVPVRVNETPRTCRANSRRASSCCHVRGSPHRSSLAGLPGQMVRPA
jgi:hypothetical protein